ARNGAAVSQLDLATLNEAGGADKKLTVKPRFVVLAAGGMENARLLLASNDVTNVGIGNQNDLVGRFFADNPIPRDTATMVLFAGPVTGFYNNFLVLQNGPVLRAVFAPMADFARKEGVLGSLT